MGPPYGAPPSADYNTFAVLSPIFAVVVPPAGVVLGHLALPQIRRTGERGRDGRHRRTGDRLSDVPGADRRPHLVVDQRFGLWRHDRVNLAERLHLSDAVDHPRPSTVTSVAPPSTVPRIKLDLATVPIGACVEIQLRSDEGNDALDLFKVDCEHKEGVYTVTARVSANYECRSVYVAAPPDRSFALCLNPY